MEDLIKAFLKAFEENKIVPFCKEKLATAGQPLIYSALLLYYAYKRKETPSWARSTIIGALGYLLAPFDAIPDLTPFLGLTDDLGILSFALVTIACYIDHSVRSKALVQLEKITKGEINVEGIRKVDSYL